MREKMKNFFTKFKSLEDSRKKLLVTVCIIVVLLIIITIITSIIFGQTLGSAGNVAGNLRNTGFAVKKGNKAYVSSTGITDNSAGTRGLYEITKENTAKLIDESTHIKSINLYKGYLYYLSINPTSSGTVIRQVVKIKPNGDKKQVLVDNIETNTMGTDSLNVSDGWIYFLNSDGKIERVKTNGEKRQPVSDEVVKYFQISGKYIYFTTNDDEFKKMKKDGSGIEKIGSGIDTFQIASNYVYYINNANQYLTRLDLKNNKEEDIVKRKVLTFNVYDKTIYYAINDTEQAIYKMKISGKKNEKLVDLSGASVNICIVGDWVYYTDKVDNSPYYYTIYRMKTNGEDKQKINV